jgi:hypothetical protein
VWVSSTHGRRTSAGIVLPGSIESRSNCVADHQSNMGCKILLNRLDRRGLVILCTFHGVD